MHMVLDNFYETLQCNNYFSFSSYKDRAMDQNVFMLFTGSESDQI